MKTVTTPIIPIRPTFAKVDAPHELHLEAICVFVAIGFFLDTDTYWKDRVVLKAGATHTLDTSEYLVSSASYFNWHYSPRDISFDTALEEFTTLFETIIKEQSQGRHVILPLSGGLDSRTHAVALKVLEADVFSYSYQFKNGFDETKIAKQIAETCGFDFKSYTIPKGYLWNSIDKLAEINQCYSDFTAPRQMAIYEDYANMGDVFSLGHWGDVLFDSMHLSQLSKGEVLEVIQSKLLKKGGLELASKLWESWELQGDFKSYFTSRLEGLLATIHIEDTNAKLRAFKSKYWAPRWTSVNLSVFESIAPIELPYYDNRMCEFICTIPEAYLNNRQLQIEYIKQNAPDLAKITWQEQQPFNLTNYHLNKMPLNLPYRVVNKIGREIKGMLGKPYVQRNWELQFLGKENDTQLKKWLFESDLSAMIPLKVIQQFYTNFKEKDKVNYAHPVSMLLTLALFNQKFNHD